MASINIRFSYLHISNMEKRYTNLGHWNLRNNRDRYGHVYIGCQKSLAVFPQAYLCKRVVLDVFVASVHARAFWKAIFNEVL